MNQWAPISAPTHTFLVSRLQHRKLWQGVIYWLYLAGSPQRLSGGSSALTCGAPSTPRCHRQHFSILFQSVRKVVEDPKRGYHGLHLCHQAHSQSLDRFHSIQRHSAIPLIRGINVTPNGTCVPIHHPPHGEVTEQHNNNPPPHHGKIFTEKLSLCMFQYGNYALIPPSHAVI